MHGVGLGRTARWGVVLVYTLCVLYAYSGRWQQIHEVLRIPLAEYALVFLFAGIAWLLARYRQARTATAGKS